MARTSLHTSHAVIGSVLLALSTVFSLPGSARAQTATQATTTEAEEPQYVGQFFLLDTNGKLTPLEQQKPTMESKTHNHFISVSSTGAQVVPNTASPIRALPSAHFIVRASPGAENIDPNTLIALKPFVVQKGERTMPISTAKAGMFQGVKSQQAADSSIALTFKKYGKSSMEVIPSQPLPPGEYALAANGGYGGVFCFGVDAK